MDKEILDYAVRIYKFCGPIIKIELTHDVVSLAAHSINLGYGVEIPIMLGGQLLDFGFDGSKPYSIARLKPSLANAAKEICEQQKKESEFAEYQRLKAIFEES